MRKIIVDAHTQALSFTLFINPSLIYASNPNNVLAEGYAIPRYYGMNFVWHIGQNLFRQAVRLCASSCNRYTRHPGLFDLIFAYDPEPRATRSIGK